MLASTKERRTPVFEVENLGERLIMLNAFRRHDAGAVRAMYRKYGRLVYAVARRALGRHDLAEEAMRQTFVHAWRAAGQIDVDRDPAPWLATIAKQVAIEIGRREAVVDMRPDVDKLDAVWQVRRAIDALSPEEATITRLQHLDGLTHEEISQKLGIEFATVESIARRAHRNLAAMLGHLRA
jgi:RNA polymerase sigma-70 factor (ECF subfamily)